jgi:transposase
MAKTLSLDLRERVVAAVFGGMSRRQAAEHYDVSPASAIRWCARQRETGNAAPKPRGGDRLSGRIEAQAGLILALVEETRDITLMELQGKLAEQGHRFAIGTLWRFFSRHNITWKKRPPTRVSRKGRTS